MAESDSASPWWVLPAGRIRPGWWLALSPLFIWVDYLAGPNSQFPIGYVLPVCVAAWYSGQRIALALATALPLAHLVLHRGNWDSISTNASCALTAVET
jgi:hypothetical protein